MLTDNSNMPFGKYRGYKMGEVPVTYLHWLWENGCKHDDVRFYIKTHMEALQMEEPDLIWTDK